MSSMPELLDKLAQREKERVAAEQEATAGIRAAEGKVNKAAEELMELKRAEEQELRVVKAQYEKRLRDTAYASRQKVHTAHSELAEAEALAARAEKRQQASEARVAELRRKLSDLQAHLKRRTESGETNLAGLERLMQARIERVGAQSRSRVEGMTEHAEGVQRSCQAALCCVEDELQDQEARAHIRAEGRIRFKDLCQLAQRCAAYDMSHESFCNLKEELVTLWQLQSTTHSPQVTGLLSPRGREPHLALQ